MMHNSDCKCPHHMVHKVVMVLTVVSAIGFWFATLMQGRLFGISSVHFFKEVVGDFFI